MSIVKKPKRASAEVPDAAAAFISGAPDAPTSRPAAEAVPAEPPTPTGVMRGNRRQIAVTFPPGTIEQIDSTARRFGMSRASYINRAVVMALESDAN